MADRKEVLEFLDKLQDSEYCSKIMQDVIPVEVLEGIAYYGELMGKVITKNPTISAEDLSTSCIIMGYLLKSEMTRNDLKKSLGL